MSTDDTVIITEEEIRNELKNRADFYYHYIDNGAQYRAAETRHKTVLGKFAAYRKQVGDEKAYQVWNDCVPNDFKKIV